MEDLGFRDKVKSTRHQALWLATLGFFGGFAGVSIFGPLVPKFKELLDLTPFAAGMLAAIPALTVLSCESPLARRSSGSAARGPSSSCLRSPTSAWSGCSSCYGRPTRTPWTAPTRCCWFLAH